MVAMIAGEVDAGCGQVREEVARPGTTQVY